jgi:hypothetical protein
LNFTAKTFRGTLFKVFLYSFVVLIPLALYTTIFFYFPWFYSTSRFYISMAGSRLCWTQMILDAAIREALPKDLI